MEYNESEPSGFKQRTDRDWPEGVHIRERVYIREKNIQNSLILYALFDGEEQVSEDMAASQADELIWFSEGYAEAKKRYSE